jgi:hypothetical protein
LLGRGRIGGLVGGLLRVLATSQKKTVELLYLAITAKLYAVMIQGSSTAGDPSWLYLLVTPFPRL